MAEVPGASAVRRPGARRVGRVVAVLALVLVGWATFVLVVNRWQSLVWPDTAVLLGSGLLLVYGAWAPEARRPVLLTGAALGLVALGIARTTYIMRLTLVLAGALALLAAVAEVLGRARR